MIFLLFIQFVLGKQFMSSFKSTTPAIIIKLLLQNKSQIRECIKIIQNGSNLQGGEGGCMLRGKYRTPLSMHAKLDPFLPVCGSFATTQVAGDSPASPDAPPMKNTNRGKKIIVINCILVAIVWNTPFIVFLRLHFYVIIYRRYQVSKKSLKLFFV